MSNKENRSKFLQYLPEVYQTEDDPFLGNFLKAFENILSYYSLPGVDIKDPASLVIKLLDNKDILSQFSEETQQLLNEHNSLSSPSEALVSALAGELNNQVAKSIYDIDILVKAFPDEIVKRKGIEEILDQIHDYFDPGETPPEFLSWLAGWMALTLKEEKDWNSNNSRKKRDLIARIIPLYQKRGTLEGMKEYIRIYVGEDVKISIYEFLDPFQVGVASTVGVNSLIGDGRPYYFQVYMELPIPDPVLLDKKRRAIIDIINQEKPAHTYYMLIIQVPTMQIAYHSTVGVDTLLGGRLSEK